MMEDVYHLSSFQVSLFTFNYCSAMFTPFSVTGCSLELLKPGEIGIVTVCQTQDKTMRRKLISMGIHTGTNITVEQHFPAFIIKAGNVSMNLDRDTVRAIYVRVLEGGTNRLLKQK
ncbi:FeoA family protein [Sphaerospermopsis kisseleviana]|nr:FeoA family protein [Sphaerospermopsis kisseleviana NIES-73]